MPKFAATHEIDPGVDLLKHACERVLVCEDVYGPASKTFAHIAARWSLVLGVTVTVPQVALCMIDLKMARLTHDPAHVDSILDVAGYAACLRAVTKTEGE